MITHDFLQFLYELSQNNNRDWFEKNKKRYESTVKKPFEATVAAIIERVQQFEPQYGPITPKDCIFRIYRDTRFSKDKSPYKTNVAAAFNPKNIKSTSDALSFPGYYFHLEFGALWIGGGAYFLDKEPLRKVRTAIMQDPEAFRALISEKNFVEKYGALRGETNKVLAPEFKEAAKTEPLLYNKQYYFMAELDPELALDSRFPDFVADHFRAGRELNAFFRKVIFG